MRSIICILIVFIGMSNIQAQVAINNDGTAPDASAMMDVKSSDKGVLIPRMTTAEMMAISNPARGLMVFNTTEDKFYVYLTSGNKWKEIEYGTNEIVLPSTFSLGTGGSCLTTVVNGDYGEGIPLDGGNTVMMQATVTEMGSWTITTNTVNGYSFSGSGSFTAIGTIFVTLYGSGTPVSAQTDNFTATGSGGMGTCTFDVVVDPVHTCGDPLVYGGQTYSTVTIGTQCWMGENINIGTRIDASVQQSDNSTIEKYCYDDLETNCDIYGGMYQWNEMMDYVTSSGAQGICPDGWHVPSDNDWCVLENYVDAGTISCTSTGDRGTDAGGNLKETGTSHWTTNTGATNSSNFTGLPGGQEASAYFNLGTYGFYWTSSSATGTSRWYRRLNGGNALITREIGPNTTARSLRCIQD